MAASRICQPNTGRLLVGIASRGGDLPADMREEIVDAINRGIDIYNGLHTFITHDDESDGPRRRRVSSWWTCAKCRSIRRSAWGWSTAPAAPSS